MNKTLKEIIALADELNPNAFSNDVKASWVSEAEHMILSEIHCLAPGEIQDLFPYEAHKDDRLTLAPGDDKIYVLYLQAMIDFSNKEYAAYNNDMALFNESLDTYAKWYVRTHKAGEALVSGMYLSAYGIAVSHGYVGTEADWLASLKGEKGDTGHGLDILGAYESFSALTTAVTSPAGGDIYQVGTNDSDKTLYLYNGTEWQNIGSYRGEKGEKGEKGDTGETPENVVTTDKANVANGYVALDSNGNIKVATGATISNPESHKGNGSIKFGEFGVEITDALGDALYFSTVGIELSCKNSGSQNRTSYRLINYDKQLPAWSNKDLFEDLKFLYEKIKNALTTDKANVANGYAALDANKNISGANGVVKNDGPLTFIAGGAEKHALGSASVTLPSGQGAMELSAYGITLCDDQGESPVWLYTSGGDLYELKQALQGQNAESIAQMITKLIEAQSSDLSSYITVNGTDVSIKSAAENGINVSTVGVSLTNGYTLASLGQSAPEGSSGNLLTDIGNILSSLTAKQNKPAAVIPEGAAGNITLSDNTEYLLNGAAGASTAITLTLPAIDATKGYSSYFVFNSGATPTTITLPASFDVTLKFKGDDCANGIFTPAANTVYEVALKCIGMDSNNKPYIVARVGAC